nr:TPA_asm: NADH dehydrogenase subunit 2 [Tetraponera aethiops]
MILFQNLCLIPIMTLMSILTLSLSNMIMIWFVMEINNFMFISMMMMDTKEKKMIFLYFITQMMASTLMIISLIINPLMMVSLSQIFMFSSLMIKGGIPPFHFWMPLISMFLEWKTIFFLCTIQKVIPLNMFNLFNLSNLMIITITFMTLVIPSISMMTMKNFKKLIIYSSINQSGWMIILIFLKHPFWLMYMMMYSLMMFLISFFIGTSKLSNTFFQYPMKKFNMVFTLMMMNMASMPPFSFFLFKWSSTFIIILNSNMKFILILMLINSLIMTYVYINMMSWSLFIYQFKSKMKESSTKFKLTKSTLIIIMIILPIFILC